MDACTLRRYCQAIKRDSKETPLFRLLSRFSNEIVDMTLGEAGIEGQPAVVTAVEISEDILLLSRLKEPLRALEIKMHALQLLGDPDRILQSHDPREQLVILRELLDFYVLHPEHVYFHSAGLCSAMYIMIPESSKR